MFKLDVINKVRKTIQDIYNEYPELYTYSDSDTSGYYSYLVPILHQRLNNEELEIFVELLCLEVTKTYNDSYYRLKKLYDAIIVFKIDPDIALIKFGGYDAIKGFNSLEAEC